jgi:large subunit ribosomal protein L5
MADKNGNEPRLKTRYQNEIIPALVKEFNYKNVMQAPRLEKVIINMGVGIAGQTGGDPKQLDNAIRDLTIIAGQKPAVTRAKKSIANFKLRAGARVGAKVTLRGARMYEFLDRCSTSRCHACVTSRASTQTRSTVVATSPWA